jgi:23S rRNA (cytidine2498-2'-O)-methyltransferase
MDFDTPSPARPLPPQAFPCRGVLVLCRSGFETEAAAELEILADEAGVAGLAGAQPKTGYASLKLTDATPLASLTGRLPLARLIFARQRLFWFDRLIDLPEKDRGTPLVEALARAGTPVSKIVLETPDTDLAKQMSGFCKRFAEPLERLLDKRALVRPKQSQLPVLHVVFTDAATAWLCLLQPGDGSPWPMGVPRLRMPREAPSRSALKLAEAFHELLGEADCALHLRAGLRAVDLGAAPGGWSWQLAQRGLHVTAVDNGPLAPSAHATGMIEHVRADGFTWRPKRPVEWMVCDMVEQPGRIAQLVADWVASGRAKRSIFNLKLPMKRRLEEVERCRALIVKRMKAAGPFELRFKHLYHDREEITGYLALK